MRKLLLAAFGLMLLASFAQAVHIEVAEEVVEECILEMFAMQGGTTSPPPGTHVYECGDTVMVEAIPAEGWEFLGWELEGSADACDPQENPCEFEIHPCNEHDHDAGFAAHFAEEDNGYQPPAAREVNIEVLPEDAGPGEPGTIHVYGTWENSCVPEYVDHKSYPTLFRIETVNHSETCLTVLTDFSFEVEVEELPEAFHVDVYYESPPEDYFALIASEWFPLWLEPGLHMLSVPGAPEDASPESVFRRVVGEGTFVIYEYVHGQYVVPTEIDPGRGYWLYAFEKLPIEIPRELPEGKYTVALDDAGWHQVSTPRWMVGWQDVTFQKGEEERSLDEAIGAGWIEPYAFRYSRKAEDYVSIELPGTMAGITPWYGYWLKTREPNLTMVLPLDESHFPGAPGQS